MKKIKLTKGASALVDDEIFDYLNQFKWCLHSAGYAVRNSYELGGHKPTLHYMHRDIMKTPTSRFIITDHINRDRLDNRRANLRVTNRLENLANSIRGDRQGIVYAG